MNNKLKILYASSPDRGLEHLLRMWNDIRKEFPEAELHNCYGFELFLKGHSNNPQMMKWYHQMQELLKQDGVFDYGRVSKEKLDEITESCDIWAYPTHFGETFCITAVRSQSLGCVPVTIAYAGLLDTVYSGVLIDGDIYEEATRKQFLKELIDLWKDQKRYSEEKKKGIEGAKRFAWSNIASEWTKYF
jgi:glycosyltransferase involved in cell wall biosynthesis